MVAVERQCWDEAGRSVYGTRFGGVEGAFTGERGVHHRLLVYWFRQGVGLVHSVLSVYVEVLVGGESQDGDGGDGGSSERRTVLIQGAVGEVGFRAYFFCAPLMDHGVSAGGGETP